MFYYTGFNRLNGTYVNGLSTHYDINPQGQRLHKYTADTDTYFAPGANGAQLAEDQNGTWMDDVYLNGRLVTVIANGGVYPVASDQTGRPLALTHPTTKAVLWSTQSLPFGGGTVTNHWGGFNLGFPGQYYDSEDALWHNGNRDYDAAFGRYIEADPLGLAGGVNGYVYVGDNPISKVDLLGLCPTCSQASAEVAALGQRFSDTGEVTTWSGIGVIAASGIAAAFFPEGGSAELDAGEYGVGLVETGGIESTIGAALNGYARDGVSGALEDGGSALAIGFADKLGAGWLSGGASKADVGGMAGLMDKAADALRQEAAACTGQ
jgi:RHS repeat-associated protein